jgi:hypothetical protein
VRAGLLKQAVDCMEQSEQAGIKVVNDKFLYRYQKVN